MDLRLWLDLALALALGGAIAIIAAQQYFFLMQIQKLIDKVMSRSYTEYIKADKPSVNFQLPQDPPEDLRSLQEFKLS